MNWSSWKSYFETNGSRPLPKVSAAGAPTDEEIRGSLARTFSVFQLGEAGEGRIPKAKVARAFVDLLLETSRAIAMGRDPEVPETAQRNGKDLNVANQPFDIERTNSETKLTIRGSLDINSAPLLAEEIDRVVATKPPKVKVDLSALDLIDSSGVAALVKLYKVARGSGGAIVISGARDQPLAIFQLLRMDHVFNL